MTDPIILMENPYAGVNPHLNSELQTPGNVKTGQLSIWPSFHSNYLGDVTNALNDSLPVNYVARGEQSLQINAEDIEDIGEVSQRIQTPKPDVTIYGQPAPNVVNEAAIVKSHLVLVLNDTLDITEDFLKAVVIRDVSEDPRLGPVVARIELLSPSNKPGRVGYEAYRKGRLDALFSGIPLIELDYLHESLPPVMTYPEYPYQRGSHPYNIFVNDPRPALLKGQVDAYGFDVDVSFPKVIIPLAGKDSIQFDFGAVYQHTFKRGRWGKMANYAEPPVRFETYSSVDQARIRARMAAIGESFPRGPSN